MKLPPNTPAPLFDLSAIIIGYILIDDLTPAEQNSIGNWFMLIGQVLCTNSAQQQVINNRANNSNNSNQHIVNDSINNNYSQNETNSQINMINKIIQAMQQEIENLKRGI